MTRKTELATERELGRSLRRLRLLSNVPQADLAAQAGISLRALRSLESGQGATLYTLLCVVRALGRDDWLDTLVSASRTASVTVQCRLLLGQRARRARPAALDEGVPAPP